MPITKRTLEKWRADALRDIEESKSGTEEAIHTYICDTNERILRLTQELLDQHLLRRKEG